MKSFPLTDPADIASAEQMATAWTPRKGETGNLSGADRVRALTDALIGFGNLEAAADRSVCSTVWGHIRNQHPRYGLHPASLWCRDAVMETVHAFEQLHGTERASILRETLQRIGRHLSPATWRTPTREQPATIADAYRQPEIDMFDRFGDAISGWAGIRFRTVKDLILGFGVPQDRVATAHANDFHDVGQKIFWTPPVEPARTIPCAEERLGHIRHLLTVRESLYLFPCDGNARPSTHLISTALRPAPLRTVECPDSRRLQATWRRNRYQAGTPLEAIWFLTGRELPAAFSGLVDPVTALTATELEAASRAPRPTQLELRMWATQ